jgi:hypothetical protein
MMKKLSLLLLLAGTVPPAFSAKSVKPEKVDQLLIHAHGKSDAKLARQFFNLELTQRVSSARFARWEAELPGPKSRQALVALADASAFLPLPPEEIPATPAPDPAAQDSLLTRAGNYVTDTIPKLPNFFATRDTTRFSDEPENIETLTMVNYQYRQLHLVGISSEKVYFRAGKEVVVANATEQASPSEKSLATQGVFGEAMKLILKDLLPSGPVWSHWEGAADAPLAVFRYTVPLERSHYTVVIPDAPGTPQPHLAYHGEIAIDRANGTVLRLTIVAELSRSSRITKGDVMVEYGPVEIGGTSHICPVKSVSLTVERTVQRDSQYKLSPDDVVKAGPPQTTMNEVQSAADSTEAGPPLTKVNDVRFKDYHQFRSEIRILPGNNVRPDPTSPASDVNQP